MSSIYLKAFFIAIIEGITEFIPISSTGHMILVGNFIQFTGEKAASFEIFIQLGAILAATIIYKESFLGLIPRKSSKHSIIKTLLSGESSPTGLQFILAVTPIMIAGLLLYKTIKTQLFSPMVVSIGLIVGGILMIIVEYLPIKKETDQLQKITTKQAFIIGLGQCMAVWPGMSRSGSTMITGLLLGIKHKAIADFSFIIAVPVMFAAVCYDLLKSWSHLDINDLGYFIIGFFVAFIIAWGSIKWFLKVLTRVRLVPFGIYRILLGFFSMWILL